MIKRKHCFTNADTQEGEEEKTCPTITLIKDKDFNIIVDPGVLETQQVLKEDPYATNSKELEQSRQKVLALADYIVPGHGPMYKIKK